jgi:hypothetical protein
MSADDERRNDFRSSYQFWTKSQGIFNPKPEGYQYMNLLPGCGRMNAQSGDEKPEK